MKDLNYIYWFAYYNEDSPSVRYRGQYPLEYFRKNHQIESTLIIPGYHPKKVLAFIRAFFTALFFCKKNELIVIQRVHSNFLYSSLLKCLVIFRKKNTVYDLDDADYLYCKPDSIYYFAKNCHSISAGSTAISNHLSRFNQNIVVTPSPTPDLGISKQMRNGSFTIGWIGGFGGDHKKTLVSVVFPAINDLKFDCTVKLLGVTDPEDRSFINNYFSQNEHILVEIPEDIHWKDEASIQQTISSFDVGIATLADNEIQLSKSGIKAKQYLNNGVPVLGTNLPENDWVIKDGINGYYCSNAAEYAQRITEFYTMEEEDYLTFSTKAKESIIDFNHAAYYSGFKKIYELQQKHDRK